MQANENFLAKPLVSADSKILHEPVEEISFEKMKEMFDPIEYAKFLAENLLAHGGIGLAANQIGDYIRVFAIKSNPIIVAYNPKIVSENGKDTYDLEGCMSFPGLFCKIKRNDKIRVRYTEPNGNLVTKTFEGLTAKIFQHELDHLNGIVFLEKANRFHKDQALRKWKKFKKSQK